MNGLMRDAVGVATTAVLAGATMVLALVAQLFASAHGVEVAYAACWVGMLVTAVPILHMQRGAHGTRALGWIAVVPALAMFAQGSVAFELTAPWHHECGQFVVGLLFSPVIVTTMVLGLSGLVHAIVPRTRSAGAALAVVGSALGLLLALTTLARSAPNAATARETLERNVRTLAVLPSSIAPDGPIDIAGSHVERPCHECPLVVDGMEAEVLQDSGEPVELAEGLGYRFLRHAGSAPATWLTYRPGDSYGRRLRASDLGRVAAPSGFGAALLLTTLVALLYVALALLRVRRGLQVRAGVVGRIVSSGVVEVGGAFFTCDPRLASGPAVVLGQVHGFGTYRRLPAAAVTVVAGERSALLAAEWAGVGQHAAMAMVLLILGCIPALIAEHAGLALAG